MVESVKFLLWVDKLKNNTFFNEIGLELNSLNWICSCLSLLIFVLLQVKGYFLPKYSFLAVVFLKVRQAYAYCFFLLLIALGVVVLCCLMDESNDEYIQNLIFSHHSDKYQGYERASGFLVFTNKIVKLAIWLFTRGGFLLLLTAYLSQRTIFSQLITDKGTLNTYLDHTAYQNYRWWACYLYMMVFLYLIYVFIMTFIGFFVRKYPEYRSRIYKHQLMQYRVLFHLKEYYIILTAVGESNKYRLYKEHKSEQGDDYLESRENEMFDCYEDCKNYLSNLPKK